MIHWTVPSSCVGLDRSFSFSFTNSFFAIWWNPSQLLPLNQAFIIFSLSVLRRLADICPTTENSRSAGILGADTSQTNEGSCTHVNYYNGNDSSAKLNMREWVKFYPFIYSCIYSLNPDTRRYTELEGGSGGVQRGWGAVGEALEMSIWLI